MSVEERIENPQPATTVSKSNAIEFPQIEIDKTQINTSLDLHGIVKLPTKLPGQYSLHGFGITPTLESSAVKSPPILGNDALTEKVPAVVMANKAALFLAERDRLQQRASEYPTLIEPAVQSQLLYSDTERPSRGYIYDGSPFTFKDIRGSNHPFIFSRQSDFYQELLQEAKEVIKTDLKAGIPEQDEFERVLMLTSFIALKNFAIPITNIEREQQRKSDNTVTEVRENEIDLPEEVIAQRRALYLTALLQEPEIMSQEGRAGRVSFHRGTIRVNGYPRGRQWGWVEYLPSQNETKDPLILDPNPQNIPKKFLKFDEKTGHPIFDESRLERMLRETSRKSQAQDKQKNIPRRTISHQEVLLQK